MRSLSLLCVAAAATAQQPEMARIPAADCPIGETVSHKEVHKPKVGQFWLGKYTVTNAEYGRFVGETGYRAPEHNSLNSKYKLWGDRSFPAEIARQPVVNVSWTDAVAYCDWLSKKAGTAYRLPTEEEWEIAARGGLEKKAYPWGDGIDQTIAWYGQKWSGAKTLQNVDFGKPNAYGLYGMAGNVWQWVEDWYVPVFDDRPVKEELHLYRVIRGGCWSNEPEFLKVDYRNFYPPEFRDLFVGFRVASSAAP
jgi:formylglycine-generating enzyme required for sulfatase activity